MFSERFFFSFFLSFFFSGFVGDLVFSEADCLLSSVLLFLRDLAEFECVVDTVHTHTHVVFCLGINNITILTFPGLFLFLYQTNWQSW